MTNLGDVEGEDAILIYAEPPHAGEGGRPLRSLVAFERTALVTTGKTATADFCLEAKAFALANAEGSWVVEQGNWTIHVDTLQHRVNVQAPIAREPAVVEEITRKPLPRGAVWA